MSWAARGARFLRSVVEGLAAGILAALIVGGLGGRALMRIIALMSRSHYGEITHDNAVVGLVTLDGTLNLMSQMVFYGVPGAVLYGVFGRWIPGTGWRRGLLFGGFLLLDSHPAVLEPDNYEFHRYIALGLSLGLFALLIPLYGLVIVPLWRLLAGRDPIRPRNRLVNALGYLGLGLWAVQGIVGLAALSRYSHAF